MKKEIIDKYNELLTFIWNQQGTIKVEQAVNGHIIKVYRVTDNLIRMDILRNKDAAA